VMPSILDTLIVKLTILVLPRVSEQGFFVFRVLSGVCLTMREVLKFLK